ncbi:MAG: helix-turn-helix transcriptional regulator [Clostridiales bacterium]|nr:helix-turn-helix transcriptional regulator [Clostridiales bacterium]
MITYENIRKKLAKAVADSQLTQEDVSKLLGIKEPVLERYISGKSKMPVYIFANLCGVLKLDVNDILCVTDYRKELQKNNAKSKEFD